MGGGASSGAAELNIFTQPNEPEKKDGIWIQSNNQYEKIITDARIMVNIDNGVISNKRDLHYSGTGYNAPCYYNYNFDCEYYNGAVYGLVDCQNSNRTVWVLLVRIDNNIITIINKYTVSSSSSQKIEYINKYMDKIYLTCKSYKSDGYSFSSSYVLNSQMNQEKVLSIPISDVHGVVEYNNTLLFISSNTAYCQFDGTSFTSKYVNAPEVFACVVYDGYIFTSSGNGLYKWDTNAATLVLSSFKCNNTTSTMCVYNNNIYYTYNIGLYKYNIIDNSCTLVADNVLDQRYPILCTDGYKLYIQSFNDSCGAYDPGIKNIIAKCADYSLSKQNFNNNTVILQRGETGNGKYQTAFADLTKSVSGVNRFISGFDDAWFYSNGGFENCPMYYGNGSQWIRFKN